MKLKRIILKTNLHLIRVNTRNSVVSTSENSPALFQNITPRKQIFKVFKGFTIVSSKLETADALKQILKDASEELSSTIQFSEIKVFFWPVSINNCFLPHQFSSEKKSKVEGLDTDAPRFKNTLTG